MPLDATAGGSSANSYATIAEFDTYWGTKLIPSGQATPASFSDADIALALMMATAELDREGFLGERVTTEQALEFPRLGLYRRDGRVVESDSIPQAVKDATCELAYMFLLDPALTEDDGLNRFVKISLGSGEVDLSPRLMATDGIPPKVTRIVKDFLSGRGARVLRA